MTDVYIRRKRGFERVEYPTPELEELLEPTYGIFTYQEQVMRAANVLAGFTLAEADVLRKAVGQEGRRAHRPRCSGDFEKRAVERGLSKREGRARSPSRSRRSAVTASTRRTRWPTRSSPTGRRWLKAHYPAEFMAALLSSYIDNTDKVVSYIGTKPRAMGIEILPPSVEESGLQVHGGRRRTGAVSGSARSRAWASRPSARSSGRAPRRPVRVAVRLLPAHRPAPQQQASHRVPDRRPARWTRSGSGPP